MAPIPFIGRLHPYEYLALVLSFLLRFLEIVVRTITLLLPSPIVRLFYRASRTAFNALSSPYSRRARNRKRAVTSPLAQAQDFTELCELYGYYTEEHIVQTKDGFLLGVHRLGWRQGEEDQRVNNGPGSTQKKVIYMHHGLMMNSEVWVCLTEKEKCLPFYLVDNGYDVWLGNNRGNKYSKKSMHHSPSDIAFWNFSMDQFAFHDIPDTINYILDTTAQPSLSYIGFSQGTAQAFATLSIHPTLNNKVDVFVALAPAMAPPGLASGIVSSLVKSHPEVLFLLFGRRAMLSSTTMWQALLYPAIFCWVIDKSLKFLFGWKAANIAPHQKLAAYPHLFSFTSVKSVVHWFQIIDKGNFQMYDDEVSNPLSLSSGSKYYKVAKFPTRNIKTPIVLVYGGSDSLVDIEVMLKELPRHTVAKSIQKYEHLDLLWASDVDKLVFPHVLEALQTYAMPNDKKPAAIEWHPPQRTLPYLLNGGHTSGSSGNQSSIEQADRFAKHKQDVSDSRLEDTDYDEEGASIPESPTPLRLEGSPKTVRSGRPSPTSVSSQVTVKAESRLRRTTSPREGEQQSSLSERFSKGNSPKQSRSAASTPRPVRSPTGTAILSTGGAASTERGKEHGPEGWWSSTSLSSAADTNEHEAEEHPELDARRNEEEHLELAAHRKGFLTSAYMTKERKSFAQATTAVAEENAFAVASPSHESPEAKSSSSKRKRWRKSNVTD